MLITQQNFLVEKAYRAAFDDNRYEKLRIVKFSIKINDSEIFQHLNVWCLFECVVFVVSEYSMGSAPSRFTDGSMGISAKTKAELLTALIGFGFSLAAAYFLLNQILQKLDPTDSAKKKSQEIVGIIAHSCVLFYICRHFLLHLRSHVAKTLVCS